MVIDVLGFEVSWCIWIEDWLCGGCGEGDVVFVDC